MTHEELIELAREAGCSILTTPDQTVARYWDIRVTNLLERFAKLVENATLERAALLVDEKFDECEPWMCGDDIRAMKT